MKNVHDLERSMYIYKQRKEEKRTFADIGLELGITGNRVRQVYRRIDWRLNGYNSDAYLKNPDKIPEYARQEMNEQ